MNSMAPPTPMVNVIVGVDTHTSHVVVTIDDAGQRLSGHRIPVDTGGYQDLEHWAKSLGRVISFGIEGADSYGVGLASYLRRNGHQVVEVNRGDRRARRANAKSDTLDAEVAARSVLARTSTAVPKNADGVVEMIRQIKVARDIATKCRTSAIITVKAVVVNAPPVMREQLDHLADKSLIEKCAGHRPGQVTEAISSTKHTLGSLAKRWQFFDVEVKDHDRILNELTQRVSPTLCDGFGIKPDTASELLIVLGDNPDRVGCKACFAKLCGVTPIPASSGMTNRHRLAWNGHR